MDSLHIENCINMLERKIAQCSDEIEAIDEHRQALEKKIEVDNKWIKTFKDELRKRVVYRKKNTSIQKVDGVVNVNNDLYQITVPKHYFNICDTKNNKVILYSKDGVLYFKDAKDRDYFIQLKIANQILDKVARRCKTNEIISFDRENNKITCYIYVYDRLLSIGVATCSPEDDFCEQIGKAIAYLRARGRKVPKTLCGLLE